MDPPDKIFVIPRVVTLIGSILIALSSGTNYIFSAYAPQLGARLHISHTQLNIIGLAANMGVNLTGPIWGRIVDQRGPRIPLIGASICLLIGYSGMKWMYDDGIGDAASVSTLRFALLVTCGFMIGLGNIAGLSTAVNMTAKSFPSSLRALTTGLVMSGSGLSAFFFSLLAHTLFPGDISALLLTLAVGTATPMLVGLLVVKPIPLPQMSSNPRNVSAIAGYNPIPSGEAPVFTDSRVSLDPSEASTDSASLLSHEHEPTSHEPSSIVEFEPPERIYPERDELPDIHGRQLWLSSDFYLIFVIMTICCGTGLMYINNVGSIAQALYIKSHPIYDQIEASKWQAAQVSMLSLANFAGRVLMGLISDFTYVYLHSPRAYCFSVVSFMFIVSQVVAISVTSVERLWVATLLVGFAYGSLIGSYSAVMIEWFGLAHFSENAGYVSFSFVVGGNIFSLLFGRNLDAHGHRQDTGFSLMTHLMGLPLRELPLEQPCLDGRACYLGSLQVTLVACIVSLGLSLLAGIRDGHKLRARNAYVAIR